MANTLKLKGFFGRKQAFNVSSATVTTGWYAGQLFRLDSPTSQPSYQDEYVELQTTAGGNIMGVAMENSTDVTSAVYGMYQPSSSKVTLLHGHSKFEIVNASATKCYETGVESAYVMDSLFCSANGKYTVLSGSSAAHPVGFITKVPKAGNSYTLGIVLFG